LVKRALSFSLSLTRSQLTSAPLQKLCSIQALRPPRSFSTTIESAGFHPFVLNTLEKLKITQLFPVQEQTYAPVFEGKDVIVKALTGSGKTFAFVLPLVQRLLKDNITPKPNSPPILVLAPTRELAIQIGAQFNHFAPNISCHAIYGGVSYIPQKHHLGRGLHVVVGTPGRILDLIKNQTLNLTNTRYYVLDEVDRMLEIGLQETVDEILASVSRKEVQTLFFSATIPPWIQKYQRDYLRNPLTIDLIGENSKVPSNVKHVALVNRNKPLSAVIQNVINFYQSHRTIVFTPTKLEAFELTGSLNTFGIAANQVHGDVSQSQRELALRAFRTGECSVLVATDVAARGLDIPEVDLVIQCSLPQTPEDYVHRSGRSGRAGRTGTAVMIYQPQDTGALKRLASEIGLNLEFMSDLKPDWEVVLNTKLQKLEEVPPIFHTLAETMKDRMESLAPQLLALVCGYSPQSYQSLLNATPGRITLEVTGTGSVTQTRIEAYVKSLGAEFPDFSKCVYSGRSCLIDFPVNLGLQLMNGPQEELQFRAAQTAPNDSDSRDSSWWREKKQAFSGRRDRRGGREDYDRAFSRGRSNDFRGPRDDFSRGRNSFQSDRTERYSRPARDDTRIPEYRPKTRATDSFFKSYKE